MAKSDYVPREVIEGKLLAALDDDDKVAIVLSERDCDVLKRALVAFADVTPSKSESEDCQRFVADLNQLTRQAFGR